MTELVNILLEVLKTLLLETLKTLIKAPGASRREYGANRVIEEDPGCL